MLGLLWKMVDDILILLDIAYRFYVIIMKFNKYSNIISCLIVRAYWNIFVSFW